MNAQMPAPWVVELKATPFDQYVPLRKEWTLDAAIKAAENARVAQRAYRTRVRPA